MLANVSSALCTPAVCVTADSDRATCHAPCSACEIQLEGSGPWKLADGGEDIDIMFTPGHTPGCISMLYKPSQASDECQFARLSCCCCHRYPPVTTTAEFCGRWCLCAWQALFTGDHLLYSAQLGRLSIAR